MVRARPAALWLLNAGIEAAARHVPIRSGLVLSARVDRSGWDPIPIAGDVIPSRSLPGFEFELADFWRRCTQ